VVEEVAAVSLHARLMAATSPLTVAQERTPEELAAALRAVVERHAPVPCPPPCCVRHEHVTCAAGCRAADPFGAHYPCADIQGVARDLAVGGD
jgi:hypothetical protein